MEGVGRKISDKCNLFGMLLKTQKSKKKKKREKKK